MFVTYFHALCNPVLFFNTFVFNGKTILEMFKKVYKN